MWLQNTYKKITSNEILYVKPAKEFNLKQDMYLKLLKPLHDLSWAGDSWFQN